MDVTRRAGGSCILCDRRLTHPDAGRTGPALGICPACAAELGIVPAEELLHLTQEEADRLPFGFIAVDAEGRVTAFNAAEARLTGLSRERVVGRSFFREVAPCTAVREFEGRFREMVRSGNSWLERFRYLFRFAGGERLVQITMTYLPAEGRGILVVRDLPAV